MNEFLCSIKKNICNDDLSLVLNPNSNLAELVLFGHLAFSYFHVFSSEYVSSQDYNNGRPDDVKQTSNGQTIFL